MSERGVVGGLLAVATRGERERYADKLAAGEPFDEVVEWLRATQSARTSSGIRKVPRR